ncbi:hypothetical protein [Brevundimonas naejangsanensis]|uniref:hypothetical protein n=1 Tax=Brevundimonas naejangsanensis TaxID=588932 RepID=UPI0013C53745|nr:hypothetical protein [Brevundimonas naejangsanensis]
MSFLPEIAPDEDGLDGWEAETDFNGVATSQSLTAAVREVQKVLSAHVPVVEDEDWTDVEIELPIGRRQSRRSKVRFRRFRSGFSAATRNVADPAIADAVTALDLSRSADSLLGTIRLREIIRSADTDAELRRWASRSSLFDVSALDFLADSEAEERFVGDSAELQSAFFELGDVVNAFTILVHRHAQAEADTGSDSTVEPDPLNRRLAPDPGAVFRSTTIALVVLNGQASPALRKVLSRSDHFRMSVQDFLEENDAEILFRDVPGMNLQIFCEMGELITEFISGVHSRQSGIQAVGVRL